MPKVVEEVSKQPGPQGPAGQQGVQGEQGPPGTSTGPAGGDLTGNYPDPSIAGGAVTNPKLAGGAVNSAKVADNSLTGADINEASLDASSFTMGRSAYGARCDPNSPTTFTDCVGTTFALPRAGRVLVTAAAGQASFDGPASGECRLEVDDATGSITHSTSAFLGELTTDNTTTQVTNGFSITAVTNTLPAGSHSFELSCDENAGDQEIHDSIISAVMIGAG